MRRRYSMPRFGRSRRRRSYSRRRRSGGVRRYIIGRRM